ncbi:TPA: AAA family ATPase [Serratia fonticola]
MRKIKRLTTDIPDVLKPARIAQEEGRLRKYYLQSPELRRYSRPPINTEIFFAESVRVALHKTFHNRCAWCETHIAPREEEIVHFRPLSNAKGLKDEESVESYGWLAYVWDNLFLSCPECDRARRNYFPVESVRAPVLSTWEEANALEKVLLINPCRDDPLQHLSLRLDGTLKALTDKGKHTLLIFRLNRSELVFTRAEQIRIVHTPIFEANSSFEEFKDCFSSDKLSPGITNFIVSKLLREHEGARRANSTSKVESFIKDSLKHNRFAFNRPVNTRVEIYEESVLLDIPETYYNNLARTLDEESRASLHLKTIEIRHFKGINRFSMNLKHSESKSLAPCTMLLGENATGKSSILQSIALTMMNQTQRKKLHLRYDDFIARERGGWTVDNIQPAMIRLIFNDGSISTFRIDEDFNPSGEGANNIVFLAYGARRFVEPRKRGGKRKSIVSNTLFNPVALLSNPTGWLQECEEEVFLSVAKAMKEILALKQDDIIFRNEQNHIMVRAHKRNTPLENMSDGYKALFYVAIDIMRHMLDRWDNLEYASGIVIIDEIETHLHPRWKMQVVGAFRRAMPGVQFIFTTHDPLCLRGMYDGEVHVLKRDETHTITEEDDLPGFQGLRTEQLLTSEYFGLLSSNDPELERKLEEITWQGGENQVVYIRQIERELSEMTVLGTSLSQRVVHEALARYLDAVTRRRLEAKDIKEDAIRAILNVLEQKGY